LSFNPIGEIPVNAFRDIPDTEDFYFQGNELQHIYTGKKKKKKHADHLMTLNKNSNKQ